MAVSALVALLLQSLGIMVGTFLCGSIPLYLSMSKTKLRVLEVMGAGLLVGASMTVVLPEGVGAIYQGTASHGTQSNAGLMWNRVRGRSGPVAVLAEPYDPETAMGIALLSGFLVMFFIDQIASPGAHAHTPSSAGVDREADRSGGSSSQHHWHGPTHRPEAMRLTRASSLYFGSPTDLHRSGAQLSSVEGSPEQMPADHDDVPHQVHAPLLRHESTGTSASAGAPSTGRTRKPSDAASHRSSTIRSAQHSRGLRQAFASIAGLIIHAAADGIAMGASAGTDDESLKLIVLLAIMIHKAPAAFGLCSLLMGQRLYKSDIRRALALFSLSTPFGALTTYLVLAVALPPDAEGDSNISPHHIGAALTFSAGTFLFVAMHAVQELTSAAADLDLDEGQPQLHHHLQHHLHARSDEGATSGIPRATSPAHTAGASAAQAPRQILGRSGRVAVFLIGTLLPKGLQAIVGHGH